MSFVPHNDALKVSYKNVGLKPGTNNVVHGFLVIETTVGTVKQIATKVRTIEGQRSLSMSRKVPTPTDRPEVRTSDLSERGRTYMFTVTRTDIGGQVPPGEKMGVKSQHKGAPVVSKHK